MITEEEEHSLWKSLRHLGGDGSDELARRFAVLPNLRQVELWQKANIQSDNGRSFREVAKLVATEAGWPDLARRW